MATRPHIILFSSTIGSLLLFYTLFTNLNLNPQTPINPHQLSGDYTTSSPFAYFHNQQVLIPPEITDIYPNVLGDSTYSKRIEVDLTQQKLYAYEGPNKVMEFLVSTGKWGRTPTGVFQIWTKLRYTTMQGGNPALHTYYYLPNVPYTMFFYNADTPKARGYGIHGTYWHDNFGTPMSHGCINMKTDEVAQLFHWAEPVLPEGVRSLYASADNPGTSLIIYGQAPQI